MKKLLILAAVFALCSAAGAQWTSDILGMHDLSPAGLSPIKGPSAASCQYCHAPHSGIGGRTPLWAQQLVQGKTYALYGSNTMQNSTAQPSAQGATDLCLSCHDGTVAPGSLVPSGAVVMTGSMNTRDKFNGSLASSHPVSIVTPLKDASNLVSSLAATGATADTLGRVKLINGTVECTTCHEPHQQNIDPISLNFLVRDSSSGQLCLACHDPNARTVNGHVNALAGWTASAHASAGNTVASGAQMGSYSTVAQFACITCHTAHNATVASGAATAASLLRAAVPAQPSTMDPVTQACFTCHSGGSNLSPKPDNIYAEFQKSSTGGSGHPFPSNGNAHDANEDILLNNNRHATCADCHNGHSSQPTSTWTAAPGLRPSQNGVNGVSSSDGSSLLTPAANQSDNCLRCHAGSLGKGVLSTSAYNPVRLISNVSDPLNVYIQMSAITASSHPVLHDANSSSSQPSLLNNVTYFDGTPNLSRQLKGAANLRIFCTDCHNSDDARESGGNGPSGPHGSKYAHLLERNYQYSMVTPGPSPNGPGSAIPSAYLYPNPISDPVVGPYALCAKCHSLTSILNDDSFKPSGSGKGGHYTHVGSVGVSCSVCHTAHGNTTGARMVNFDMNVVADNDAVAPWGGTAAYNGASCTLVCHTVYHNADGTVTATKPTGTSLKVLSTVRK